MTENQFIAALRTNGTLVDSYDFHGTHIQLFYLAGEYFEYGVKVNSPSEYFIRASRYDGGYVWHTQSGYCDF